MTKDTPPASARQMIDFEGLVNCRDLGGLALEGFGVTRSGVLYRSETPQLMTPADVARAVGELGIGRVVDLRGKSMLGKDLGGSGPVGGDGRGVNIDFLEMAGGMSVVEQSPDGLLVHLLDCGGPPYKAFLEQFVSTDAAVLVHCHTGKDRTGFVVAMTLALAGGDNVFAHAAERYPTITPDALREADPDRVFLSSEPFPFTAKHAAELSGATGLPLERFVLVDGELLSWHGSRTPRGIDYAGALLASG